MASETDVNRVRLWFRLEGLETTFVWGEATDLLIDIIRSTEFQRNFIFREDGMHPIVASLVKVSTQDETPVPHDAIVGALLEESTAANPLSVRLLQALRLAPQFDVPPCLFAMTEPMRRKPWITSGDTDVFVLPFPNACPPSRTLVLHFLQIAHPKLSEYPIEKVVLATLGLDTMETLITVKLQREVPLEYLNFDHLRVLRRKFDYVFRRESSFPDSPPEKKRKV